VEYSLTEDGLTLKPVLDQINEWAAHLKQKVNNRSKP